MRLAGLIVFWCALSQAGEERRALAAAGGLVDQGDYQGALRTLAPFEEKLKGAAEYHGLLGVARAGAGDPAGAIASLQAALRIEPANENYYMDLARVLGDYDAHEASIGLLEWAAARYPKSARLRVALAFIAAGRMQAARAAAEQAIAVDPALETGYSTLAMVYEDEKDWPALVEVAGRLRKLNAGNFLAWYYLGVGQAGQAGLEATGAAEAERALRRVIRLNPGFPPAYFQLGKLLLERGETAGAIRRLSRAVELKPDYAEAHFLLARAFRKTGDAGRWQEELEIHRKLLAEEQARKRPHIEVQLALPE